MRMRTREVRLMFGLRVESRGSWGEGTVTGRVPSSLAQPLSSVLPSPTRAGLVMGCD